MGDISKIRINDSMVPNLVKQGHATFGPHKLNSEPVTVVQSVKLPLYTSLA